MFKKKHFRRNVPYSILMYVMREITLNMSNGSKQELFMQAKLSRKKKHLTFIVILLNHKYCYAIKILLNKNVGFHLI